MALAEILRLKKKLVDVFNARLLSTIHHENKIESCGKKPKRKVYKYQTKQFAFRKVIK